MTVPGTPARHAIITPTCRLNRGDTGAFDEAVARLRQEYEACLPWHSEHGSHFHVVLFVERKESEASPT